MPPKRARTKSAARASKPVKGSKRQKTKHNAVEPHLDIIEAFKRKKRGILERVAELPIDLLCEIFCYLNPKDVLALSRTSRDLNAFLTDSASTCIWQAARRSDPLLPPLPKHWTELEFAEIVFDTHCQECGKPSSKYVLWAVKLRLCKACMDGSNEILSTRMPEWVDIRLRRFIPFYQLTQRDGRVWRDIHYYHIETADELMAELEASSDVEECLMLALFRFKAGVKLGKKMDRYVEARAVLRKQELDDMREERYNSIIARLTSLGWGEDLQHSRVIEMVTQREGVNQPKPLTEEAWSILSPPLIRDLQRLRDARRKETHELVLSKRVSLFIKAYSKAFANRPLFPALPSGEELSRIEPFNSLIFNTPTSIAMDESALTRALETQFHSIAATWRDSKIIELKAMLLETGHTDDLSLAMNAFECRKCHVLLHYPDVLVHFCYRRGHWWYGGGLPRIFSLAEHVRVDEYDSPSCTQLRRVIEACGLDPKTASREEMDALNVYVTCVACNEKGKWCTPNEGGRKRTPKTFAMRWYHAPVKIHALHGDPQSWQVLKDPAIVSALKQKDSDLSMASYELEEAVCIHCGYVEWPSKLRHHMKAVHGLSTWDFANWKPLADSSSLCRVMMYSVTAVPNEEGSTRYEVEKVVGR